MFGRSLREVDNLALIGLGKGFSFAEVVGNAYFLHERSNPDECRRSIYGLWRQGLEYFDAFIIGLTATPFVHTLGILTLVATKKCSISKIPPHERAHGEEGLEMLSQHCLLTLG